MLTQWIQKIISMLLVMSAVLQVIPGKDYEKYIRFFCGLVLILLALSPIAALKGLKAEQFYQKEVYQQYEKRNRADVGFYKTGGNRNWTIIGRSGRKGSWDTQGR